MGMRNHCNNNIRSGCRQSVLIPVGPVSGVMLHICHWLSRRLDGGRGMYMLLYLPYYGGESDKLFESEMYARGRGILHAIMTIINTSVDFGKNFHYIFYWKIRRKGGEVRSPVLIFKKSLISIAIGIYKRNVKYAMRASTNQTN